MTDKFLLILTALKNNPEVNVIKTIHWPFLGIQDILITLVSQEFMPSVLEALTQFGPTTSRNQLHDHDTLEIAEFLFCREAFDDGDDNPFVGNDMLVSLYESEQVAMAAGELKALCVAPYTKMRMLEKTTP